MNAEQSKSFRTHFYRQLTLGPLEPDDPRYVRLYDLPELRDGDPVELLRFAIDANPPPTAHLVTGFRGTGKSTELRRLRSVMKEAGYVVLLCDLESFIDTGQPVEPVDFLYAFVLAVSDAMVETFGAEDSLREGYLERVKNFLVRTEVSAPELNIGAKVGGDLGHAEGGGHPRGEDYLEGQPLVP